MASAAAVRPLEAGANEANEGGEGGDGGNLEPNPNPDPNLNPDEDEDEDEGGYMMEGDDGFDGFDDGGKGDDGDDGDDVVNGRNRAEGDQSVQGSQADHGRGQGSSDVAMDSHPTGIGPPLNGESLRGGNSKSGDTEYYQHWYQRVVISYY